jgi:hypothetical protein
MGIFLILTIPASSGPIMAIVLFPAAVTEPLLSLQFRESIFGAAQPDSLNCRFLPDKRRKAVRRYVQIRREFW